MGRLDKVCPQTTTYLKLAYVNTSTRLQSPYTRHIEREVVCSHTLLGKVTILNKADEKPKPNKLIMFAFINACVQIGIWYILSGLSLATFGYGSSPVIEITRDDPMFSFVMFVFRDPALILPVLSIALLLARESRRWQAIALIAMFLSAGLMLLSVLFLDNVFLIPMVGYIVSAVLVGLVLVITSEHLRGFCCKAFSKALKPRSLLAALPTAPCKERLA